MQNFISRVSIDRSMLIVNELFPPSEPQTKFDKGVDLVKALSCATIPGAIGQVLEAGIKTFQVLCSGKQKIEAVKYVSNMYEMQQKTMLELKRLQIQDKDSELKNRNITLYIDKFFQARIDELTNDHLYKMKKLDTDRQCLVHAIDKKCQSDLCEIDRLYATIIRENEAKCALYRQYLRFSYEQGASPGDLIAAATERYFVLLERAYADSRGNAASTEIIFNHAMNCIRWIGDPSRFISFNDFIGFRNELGVDHAN